MPGYTGAPGAPCSTRVPPIRVSRPTSQRSCCSTMSTDHKYQVFKMQYTKFVNEILNERLVWTINVMWTISMCQVPHEPTCKGYPASFVPHRNGSLSSKRWLPPCGTFYLRGLLVRTSKTKGKRGGAQQRIVSLSKSVSARPGTCHYPQDNDNPPRILIQELLHNLAGIWCIAFAELVFCNFCESVLTHGGAQHERGTLLTYCRRCS